MFYGMPTLQLTKISGFLMSIKNKTRQNKAENPKPKDKCLQISPDKSSIWMREQKVKALPDAEQEPPASAPQDSAFPQHSFMAKDLWAMVGGKSLELLSNLGGSTIL